MRRSGCIIPEGNHSLESGNVDQDISALQGVIRLTEEFILEEKE